MSDVINILLVDDEARNLDALEAILEDPGYQLLRAQNADTALRLLLDHPIAAIVLDIKMPEVSGFELATMIKGTRRFREIPIVFLTAYLVDDQDVLAGYGAGAVDYLTKPVKPQILRHKIAVFAELFRKTRALAELNEALEQRVQERTAELAASSRQKDEFLATLAHELRNPLAPLRTGLDMLLGMPEPPPGIERALGAMNRQLDHMVRLIDDLLDVARVSRGMLELKKDFIDLADVIETAIEITGPFLVQRKQTVVRDIGGPALSLIDRTRVCQIIGNLLHNAAKYSAAGSEIRIELVVERATAEVRVIDVGAGIPTDQLDRVFDMFSKIDRAMPNANSGLGIGLALARQLAAMHGGTLSVASAGEGHGASFTLSLPLASTSSSSVVPASAAKADSRRTGTTALEVLIIEDNEDGADLLAAWIEELGHRVRVGRTGLEGLDLLVRHVPDIVFCDVGLPDIDGVEVCRRVKALGLDAPPVMVALTGWGMEADRRRTHEVGFDHHLVKPAALDLLREILDDLARHHGLQTSTRIRSSSASAP